MIKVRVRLFNVHMLGLYIIEKHSHRHKLHRLVMVLYGFAFIIIFLLIVCLMFLLVNCQMYLLSFV